MKRLLLFICLLSYSLRSTAQDNAVLDVADLAAAGKQKAESYIAKKGFAFTGTDYKTDTVQRDYEFRSKIKIDSFPVQRSITSFSTKEDFSLAYHTTSTPEYRKILSTLKSQGFFCNTEKDSLSATPRLFQHNDLTVCISRKPIDDSTADYTFVLHKQELPKPKQISFAEDLSAFNSHECLRFYFGDKNVKKDVYYLSDMKLGKCSILFPNTSRQAVFLWGDEVNNCNLSKIYIGGELMAETNMTYENNIPENEWRLRSGVHPGMSLYQLRMLNDAAFEISGGNSPTTGLVAADSTGKINFKMAGVILGCMNCTDPAFSRMKTINSDVAIQEERILFVHTIILDPRIKPEEKPEGK
ncbi:MAG: hypothetical protein JST86_15650 [Bacteroidetes bacterium]|nr:hypothetical protein [Bacteroidota bacterium]